MLKLKEIRERKGLTQDNIATLLNVQRFAVSKWECGKSTMNHEQIIELCKHLKIRSDELLGMEEKNENNTK